METSAEIQPIRVGEKKYTVKEVFNSVYYTFDFYDENEITDGKIYCVSTLNGQHTTIDLTIEELQALLEWKKNFISKPKQFNQQQDKGEGE